jgi:hypothetical protein
MNSTSERLTQAIRQRAVKITSFFIREVILVEILLYKNLQINKDKGKAKQHTTPAAFTAQSGQ